MTNTDLSILADALTFALVLTIGGGVLYAVARATLRRTSRQMLVAGLPVMALLAVALAGTAVWPFARERVNEAVGVRLDPLGQPIASVDPELDDPPLAGSSGFAPPARLFTVASIGTDGGVDPATTGAPHDGAVDGQADGGSGGDPGDGGGTGDGTGGSGDGGSGGGGTDPSPTDEPSPTVEPSPTTEPSPTVDPSPTPEPSPTDDPPGPPWGSPGPPPKD